MVIDGDQGLTLLAAANPVPDPDKTDSDTEAGAPVTPTPSATTERKISSRSATPWLVAAAVIVVLGAVVVLFARATSAPVASETTWIEGLDDWLRIPAENYDGTAGTYRTRYFPVDFSYTTPGDWHAHDTSQVVQLLQDETEDRLRENPEEHGEHISVQYAFEETVDGWLEDFLAVEGITTTEPVDVVLGGAPGKTFKARAVGDQAVVINENDPEDSEDDWRLPAGPGFLVYVVSVGYETVVITVEPGRAGADFYEIAQPIIDSIDWRDLN